MPVLQCNQKPIVISQDCFYNLSQNRDSQNIWGEIMFTELKRKKKKGECFNVLCDLGYNCLHSIKKPSICIGVSLHSINLFNVYN